MRIIKVIDKEAQEASGQNEMEQIAGLYGATELIRYLFLLMMC